MRAFLQRVKQAKVEIDGNTVGEIGRGLMVLLGVGPEDEEAECDLIVRKLTELRIFEDEAGKMNLSIADIQGEFLVVSQFTLYADCRKGRRPGFTGAAAPQKANTLYESVLQKLEQKGFKAAHGEFGADMQVYLQNDGPVSIMLDTAELSR